MISETTVPGALIRIRRDVRARLSKRARRREGVFMWSDSMLRRSQASEDSGPGVNLVLVPWDAVGIVLGVDMDVVEGVSVEPLVRVLFPQGTIVWWPDRFEVVV